MSESIARRRSFLPSYMPAHTNFQSMRTLVSLLAASLSLAAFTSCSAFKGDVTKGDLAAFKLRDLTRFGQPHIVKVSHEEIQQLEKVEQVSGHMASLSPKHRAPSPSFRAPVPVNYVPPRLPEGAVAFDGSILPPKSGGQGYTAMLDIAGSVPGQRFAPPSYAAFHPQDFSIE